MRRFDLPDVSGARALVTGASDGIGLEIAGALAGAGAAVVLPVRNREKGERATMRIRSSVPDARLELRDLDLARLESVSALAEVLREEGSPLDYVVLNAGLVMLGDPQRHVTVDGFELHFQTNFLGHFALTLGLLPLLRASRARVVAQVSMAAAYGRLDWGDLQLERRYAALRAYGPSKVALGLFASELARRSAAGGWGVEVGISHPGIAPDTAIAGPMRAKSKRAVAPWSTKLGNSTTRAALPALMALTCDAPVGSMCAPAHGVWGAPRWRRAYRSISDPVASARLWDFAERLCAERGIAIGDD